MSRRWEDPCGLDASLDEVCIVCSHLLSAHVYTEWELDSAGEWCYFPLPADGCYIALPREHVWDSAKYCGCQFLNDVSLNEDV